MESFISLFSDHCLLAFGAYILGAIPVGLLIGKMAGKQDITKLGSGNTGATNVVRVVGKKAGAVVALLDVLKALGPTLYGIHLDGPTLGMTLGICAVAGHCFSPFLQFKGGKGMATSVGTLLPLAPDLIGISLGIFIWIYATTRTVSLGSMGAMAGFMTLALITRQDPALIWGSGFLAVLTVVRHRTNLERLMEGQENQFQKT